MSADFHTLKTGVYYDVSPSILPSVKILCMDANGSEELTVFDDATGMRLSKVLQACAAKAQEWEEGR